MASLSSMTQAQGATPLSLRGTFLKGDPVSRPTSVVLPVTRIPVQKRLKHACSPSASSAASPSDSSAPSVERKRPSFIGSSRRRLLAGSVAGLVAAACPFCGPAGGNAAHAAEWSYGSLSGPMEWGGLCATGGKQSPIDVPMRTTAVDNASMGNIKFFYEGAPASYLNTGHGTMQVNFPRSTNFAKVGERMLELIQFHFHSPSEHSFNGTRTAMEAHLVHRDQNTGRLAVIGVMMEGVPSAPPNPAVDAAIAFAPEEHGVQSAAPYECVLSPGQRTCSQLTVNPSALLPKADRKDGGRSYIHYEGSLTTPPCSEGVDWFLMASAIKVPDSQVVEFMKYVGDRQTLALNARPVQALGERTLFLGP